MVPIEARRLAAFRDTLLPKLLSGDIKVRAGESFLAEIR